LLWGPLVPGVGTACSGREEGNGTKRVFHPEVGLYRPLFHIGRSSTAIVFQHLLYQGHDVRTGGIRIDIAANLSAWKALGYDVDV